MKKEHPYINIGGTTIVPKEDVLGVFDLDTASTKKDTKRYLAAMDKAKHVVTVGTDLPKAFVITTKQTHDKVYITTLSAASLHGRWERQSKYL